jgi:hypothetical protein
MNMSQRARQMMKQWMGFFILLIVLHVLLIFGWILLEPFSRRSFTPTAVLMGGYLFLLTVILFVFYRNVTRAFAPPEYEFARQQGIPAAAKVLDIERTRWRIRRKRNFGLRSRPTRFEYQMRIRVTRPGESDYEAALAEFLVADQVPKKGDVIPVKIHPQNPEVIVMVLDQPS